jgi:triphosphoribosyl-dephospho-CoA synthase
MDRVMLGARPAVPAAEQGLAGRTAAVRPSALALGRAATLALYDELALSPKPGLVTLVDRGSHDDMDARTFLRSLLALRGYFPRVAELGAQGAPFDALQRCGLEAEARMTRATQGINTHRGAVFTLGLLCAAGGALAASGRGFNAAALRDMLRQRWGDDLALRAQRAPTLPGGLAARRHGLRSASGEAALGFPVLFDTAWPALQRGLSRGLPRDQVLIDVLFSVMAVLDDANLAHRGGLPGLRFAQAAARQFLAAGGAAAPDGLARAHAVGRAMVARRLSPGGAADMLAAACWMQRAERAAAVG